MSTYYMVKDELNHHGVKGMKWGVRKSRIYKGTRRRVATQLQGAKNYGAKHTTGGIIARQIGKTFVQNLALNLAIIPVAAIAGPAAVPLVSAGANAASAVIGLNNTAKAATAIAYRHKVIH